MFSNWSLISSAPSNFLHPQVLRASSQTPRTWMEIFPITAHHLWGEKIMKIRFALNRFFMAARNNAISESLYMQFTLPDAWQKALAFHCAWSMALCAWWLNLAGGSNGKCYDHWRKGMETNTAPCLLRQTKSRRNLSAGHKNVIPAMNYWRGCATCFYVGTWVCVCVCVGTLHDMHINM